MASRQSKRRSRAQKRRRQSMRGGRREEEKPVVVEEEKAPATDATATDATAAGGLFGMFSGDAKKDALPSEVPADAVEGAPTEEVAPAAPTEGADALPSEVPTEVPAEEPAKKKGKKRRHGKYYTPKQLKVACKRLSSKKRHHKNRPFPMERRGPAMMSNPYAFGERPMM